MSTAQLAVLGAWIMVALAVSACLMWVVPTLARIHFLGRIEVLRDSVVDKAIDGDLPWGDLAVREFVGIQDAFLERSRQITLARVVAYVMAFERMGVQPGPRASLDALTDAQRAMIKDFEEQSKEALATYLIWGSLAGYMSYALYMCVSFFKAASAKQLAGERYEVERQEVDSHFGGLQPPVYA